MYPWTLLVTLLALLGLCAEAASAPLTLYVAPGGRDTWSGRLPQANAARSDGPLGSLAGARDVLRRLKAAGGLPGPVEVVIKAGTYRLRAPVEFTPEDSGTAQCPIRYVGEDGAIVSGGRRITGWRQQGKAWVVDLPQVRAGFWWFEGLWVNGERARRARLPNTGYLYTAGKASPLKDAAGRETPRSNTAFRYRPGDLDPSWEGLEEATVVVYHAWETSLLHVQHLDPETNTVDFTGPAAWPFESWGPRQRYHVENLPAALDEPGEWLLSRRTGLLSYLPRKGEDMRTAEVVAPRASRLIVLQGEPAAGRFVEHLTFANLRLLHTDWPIAPSGHSDGQAAASVGAAVEMTGARHCAVERCTLAHLGTYGIWFRAGCQDNRAFHNHLYDLGAGGVRIGEGGNPASQDEAALRNVVDDNFIHDAGRIFRGAVGVWIGRSSYNTVSHNEICDLDYTAVSVGWSWGYDPSSANHNVIEYNHLHHYGRGVLSDLGAIYSLGISPGTVERYNLIHDAQSYQYGGWGIYTDEGSSGILIENNVVYNTTTGGFHQHYGKENIVRNNIFAFSQQGQLQRSRPEEHISFFFERNIVVDDDKPLLVGNWENGWYRNDYNLYWDYANPAPEFFGMTFPEWQAKGRDIHSLVADPLFGDARRRDFRLRPGSPAARIGFQPIDLSQVGLYGEPDWRALPRSIKRPAPPRVRMPRVRVADSFEDTPVGEQAAVATTYEEEGATVRVTEETAASGKRALKFIDRKGLRNEYDPHLVYNPVRTSGTARLTFYLRVEPGVGMYHEWRDARMPYRLGPDLHLDRDGRVLATGKPVTTVPPGTWARYTITCHLGKQANGQWDLEVQPAGGKAQRFPNLPCGDADFRELRWLGWVAQGEEEQEGAFYLDEVKLTP